MRQPGCNVTLFIVVPEDRKDGSFDSSSYQPTRDKIDKFLKQLKDSSQCQDCEGSCSIDWSPEGFKNHTLGGARFSTSPSPNLLTMFCADVEIPVLCRQIVRGTRETAD
jgi:hypothetical protein